MRFYDLLAGVRSGLSLALMLSIQDLKNRYTTSFAGAAWVVGVPLVNALVMAVVFSVLMNGRMGLDYGDAPFVLFYFVPFSLWIFFTEMVGRSTSILKEYSYLISKIAFPFWILPLIPIASALIGQLIITTIFSVLILKFGLDISNSFFWYIYLWFLTLLLSVGTAYFVSAISVYLPDLNQVVPIVLNLIFWMTPILYPPNLVLEHAPSWLGMLILDYNPFYYLAEMSRAAVLAGRNLGIDEIGGLTLLALVVVMVGLLTFRKLKDGFSDVI